MGDELPILPISSLAVLLQIGVAMDLQSPQNGEALYPLWQGFYALTIPDLKLFKGGGKAA
jgi:hypothetical protein